MFTGKKIFLSFFVLLAFVSLFAASAQIPADSGSETDCAPIFDSLGFVPISEIVPVKPPIETPKPPRPILWV